MSKSETMVAQFKAKQQLQMARECWYMGMNFMKEAAGMCHGLSMDDHWDIVEVLKKDTDEMYNGMMLMFRLREAGDWEPVETEKYKSIFE